MEHLSRLTTRDVDLLFMLSDSSRRGILTAGRIRNLIRELKLNITRDVLVLNRMSGVLGEDLLETVKDQQLELAGVIPADEEIYRYDLDGIPTVRLPDTAVSLQAAWAIFDRLIK